MDYGKINTETNYLMGSSQMVDDTWTPLSEFKKDRYGRCYTYYIDKNTPDMEKNESESREYAYDLIQDKLDELTVAFTPSGNTKSYMFGASERDQSKIVIGMMVLSGTTNKRNYYTKDKIKLMFTYDDFKNLLDTIEPAYQAATN